MFSDIGKHGASIEYNGPAVVDYGSIALHTFTRCGSVVGPLKDFPDVPHHIDNHGECSALDLGVGVGVGLS